MFFLVIQVYWMGKAYVTNKRKRSEKQTSEITAKKLSVKKKN